MSGPGLFGDMFDFDNDGKLDWFEEAAEMHFYQEQIDEDKKKKKKYPWEDSDTDENSD